MKDPGQDRLSPGRDLNVGLPRYEEGCGVRSVCVTELSLSFRAEMETYNGWSFTYTPSYTPSWRRAKADRRFQFEYAQAVLQQAVKYTTSRKLLL
jgi:hypothetical protein